MKSGQHIGRRILTLTDVTHIALNGGVILLHT